MTAGYVYVLSNPSMPGIIKIGRSIHGGAKRAKDIYQTGVPSPFKVEFEVFVNDCQSLEADMHDRLSHRRVNGDREFFKYSPDEAIIEITDMIARNHDLEVCIPELTVSEESLAELLVRAGIKPTYPEIFELASAIKTLLPNEIRELLDRCRPYRKPDTGDRLDG